MEVNYRGTLIAVAEDCPVEVGTVPTARGGKKTIPLIQYEILKAHPYEYTSEEVLFESNMLYRGISKKDLKSRRQELWDEFWGRPQACLRASGLPKKYGWGIHCDEEGKIALCPMESAEYHRHLRAKSGKLKILKALRSGRA